MLVYGLCCSNPGAQPDIEPQISHDHFRCRDPAERHDFGQAAEMPYAEHLARYVAQPSAKGHP